MTIEQTTPRLRATPLQEPGLNGDTHRRGIHVLLIRYTPQGVLSLLALVVPFSAPWSNRLIAAGAGVAGIGAALMVRRVERIRDPIIWENLIAGAIAVVAAGALPELWHGMVMIFTVTAIGAGGRVRPFTVMAPIAGLAILAVIGATADVANLQATIALSAITICVTVISNHWWFKARSETDRRYEQLAHDAKAFFWEIDSTRYTVSDVNGDTVGALGWSRAEVVGEGVEQFVESGSVRAACEELRDGETRDLVLAMRHRDGHLVPFRSRVEASEPGIIRGSSIDATESRTAQRTIKWQAQHDHLTGLLNRDTLRMALEQKLDDRASHLEDPDARPLVAILMLDLDRFCEVNDTLGHAHGDTMLQTLSDRFLSAVGDTVEVARVGGDEFGFVLSTESGDFHRLTDLSEAILSVLNQPVTLDGVSVTVTASIGVAVATDDSTAIELLRQVDIALREAKRSRARVVQFSPSQQRSSLERLTLAARLETAIQNGEVRLWLQKKVDARTGRTIGAEALARWLHPEFGLLTPGDFLDLIEISDLHEQFADIVLTEGVRLLAECRAVDPDFILSINMTPRAICSPGFPRRVAKQLTEAGLDTSALTIEITEREIDDLDAVVAQCRNLTSLGVTISIDDFGMGWSSFDRLRKLPVGEIKIDQSFVRSILLDRKDLLIAQSIVDLASSLDIDCVAEGIEEAAHADVLIDLGCRTLQGFHFGTPQPSAMFVGELGSTD